MNDELKAKYSRIANDPSQLEMFKNDQIDVVATLQEAIEGKAAFDGQFKLIYHGGPSSYYTISKEDLEFMHSSTKTRLVKTSESLGLLVYMYTTYYLYELNFSADAVTVFTYNIPLDATEETHIDRTSKIIGTKLYLHDIVATKTGYTSLKMSFISNMPRTFSSMDTICVLINRPVHIYQPSNINAFIVAAKIEYQKTSENYHNSDIISGFVHPGVDSLLHGVIATRTDYQQLPTDISFDVVDLTGATITSDTVTPL